MLMSPSSRPHQVSACEVLAVLIRCLPNAATLLAQQAGGCSNSSSSDDGTITDSTAQSEDAIALLAIVQSLVGRNLKADDINLLVNVVALLSDLVPVASSPETLQAVSQAFSLLCGLVAENPVSGLRTADIQRAGLTVTRRIAELVENERAQAESVDPTYCRSRNLSPMGCAMALAHGRMAVSSDPVLAAAARSAHDEHYGEMALHEHITVHAARIGRPRRFRVLAGTPLENSHGYDDRSVLHVLRANPDTDRAVVLAAEANAEELV